MPDTIWGVSNNGGGAAEDKRRAALEARQGAAFNGQRRNLHFGHKFPLDEAKIAAHSPYVYRNQDCVVDKANLSLLDFEMVATGFEETYLGSGGLALADTGLWSPERPFLFSFHHEQVVNQVAQPRPEGDAQDYCAAYWAVREEFHAQNLLTADGGPIAMVWCPLQSQFLGPALGWPAYACDPGRNAYEVVGVDAYNKRQGKNRSLRYGTDAHTMLLPVVSYAAAAGKPWGIFEIACEGGTVLAEEQEKVEWLESLGELLDAYGVGWGPGQCIGIYWTDEGRQNGPGTPTSSDIAFDAYKALMPRFLPTPTAA